MNNESYQPLISICVPTYNGYPYISYLIDELLYSPRSDFEIVVSDDCSNDQTWQYLKKVCQNDIRIRCFQNRINLGMDRNFAKSVALAHGSYIWLCGQDDLIKRKGIDTVVEAIKKYPDLDFIYMSHIKIQEGKVNYQKDCIKGNKNSFHGQGLPEFLRYHDNELPTFLPKFIIRKALWEKVDISHYYGTYYCQVGVFIESSENIKWCYLGGNFVTGLTPVDGWQVRPESFTNISIGLYVMLHRAIQKCHWLDKKVRVSLVKKYYKRLLFSCILTKTNHIIIEKKRKQDVLRITSYSPLIYSIIKIILIMPRGFSLALLKLILLRRNIRSFLFGLNSEGPKIDEI